MFDCKQCKLKYKELNNNICILCNIIRYNNKSDSYNIIIGYSDSEQYDIIRKTYEFFIKHDQIPKPHDIDLSVKIIKINPYIFRQFILYYKKNKLIDSKLIDNYKIFFTNAIDLNKIKSKRFPLKYKSERLNIDYLIDQKELAEININIENLYKNFTRNIIYINE